ncbi:MAG TPA: hypothetical protein VJR05_07685 [Acidimicrobiia bacterium]|nr:hypothetical protein [Acidimicrobiia bacterium]
MIIDCATCLARNVACQDCVVNVLFHEGLLELDEDEEEALRNLAEAGLISRLQFLRPPPPVAAPEADRRGA